MGLLWECSKCKYRNPEKSSACRKCGSKPPQYKVWWIEYYDLNKKRRRERVGPSKRAAEIRLAQVKQELAEGKVLPEKQKGMIPFSEFWEKFYMPYIQNTNSPGWVKRKQQIYKHLYKFFGSKKLKEITRLDVEKFRQARLSEGVTPAEVNREVAVLKHCLNYAIKIDMLSINPASRIGSLREKAEDAWHPLTKEQAKKLTEAMSEGARPIIEFALATGLRISNILNLQWEQVDLQQRKLIIASEETKAKKQLVLPLSKWAVKILEQHRLKRQHGHQIDTGYVFINQETGKPYTVDGLRSTFKRALKRAGLPESIRLHDLRHTFASWAIEAGVDFRILKELLGHSTLEMALRYTHLSHKTLLQQIDRIPFPDED